MGHASSPQTLEAALPLLERGLAHGQQGERADPVGRRHHLLVGEVPGGRGVRLAVRPGLELSAYDLAFAAHTESTATSNPCFTIVVLLEGEGQGWIAGDDPRSAPDIRYAAETLYLSYLPVPVAGRAHFPAGGVFRFIELRLTPEFVARLGLTEVLTARLARRDGDPDREVWLHAVEATGEILSSAKAIYLSVFGDGCRDVLIEAHALTILGAVHALIARPPPRPGSPVMAERDAAKLAQAYDLLCGDLARAWTIAELARLVGLNEKRLKSGFKARFGDPVYAFLQHRRLAEGRNLLKEGRASVTEVAQSVGYANASHFAALFRRRFGVRPSDIAGA